MPAAVVQSDYDRGAQAGNCGAVPVFADQCALSPDARVRGRTLDQLTRSTIVRAERPPHWAVVQAELRDMEQLDIPYFDSPLGSAELNVAGAGVLHADGIAQAVARVERLSNEDLAWQVRLIRAAVHAGIGSAHADARGVGNAGIDAIVDADIRGSRAARTASRQTAAAVTALRDALVSTAVRDRTGAATWLTLTAVRETEVLQLGLAPAGLFAGLAGIVAFLYACAGQDESDQPDDDQP